MITLKNEKRYLITGGTGFLGQELIKRLVSQGITNLVVVARNEGNLLKLKDEYPCIEIISGDISDECVVNQCFYIHGNINGVFHLAAFKHVGLAETESYQCSMSNIKGSENILKRVHIDKSFVLTFKVDLEHNFILFTDFDHHDRVYN